MIASLDRNNREALMARFDDISALYRELSDTYQKGKGGKGIPLV